MEKLGTVTQTAEVGDIHYKFRRDRFDRDGEDFEHYIIKAVEEDGSEEILESKTVQGLEDEEDYQFDQLYDRVFNETKQSGSSSWGETTEKLEEGYSPRGDL
ncbi:MAG: hypothetical protein ABEK16_01115 [Candidatus Nanohalobium sp.]